MRRACLSALAALTLALAGCSTSTSTTTTGSNLARPGPYAVGVTTLDLGTAGHFGERLATVFYPADSAKLAGHALFSYKLGDPLPPRSWPSSRPSTTPP